MTVKKEDPALATHEPRRDGSRPLPEVKLDSRMAILQEISLALNSTLDPERLIELILDSSIRYTGATTGSFILMRDGVLTLFSQAMR